MNAARASYRRLKAVCSQLPAGVQLSEQFYEFLRDGV